MCSSSRSSRVRPAGPAPLLALAAALAGAPAAGARAAEDWPPKPLESPTMEWKVSAEVGYRDLDLDGSEPLFRSHSNLDKGVRLFGLSLRGLPKGATSRFMDSLEIDASGLGGDPQEWFHFTMRKRGTYRWDVRFNQSDYFFDVPDFTRFGQHSNKNDRRSFDTLLELNPGSARVYVGYTRRDFEGPAFLTQDLARDEFIVFAPVDRKTDDVRAGIDFKVGTWDLSFEQSYRRLDSLSLFEEVQGDTAGNTNANASLTSFTREVPLEGTYWISRASAHSSFADRVDLTLRLVHSDGETEGSSDQVTTGNWFSGAVAPFTETVTTSFGSDLPSSLAEVGVSIRLSDSVYLNNNFRYHDYEIDGETDEQLVRVGTSPTATDETFSRLTDWTSWEARTEAEWRASRRVTLRGGYRRLDREVTFTTTDVNNLTSATTESEEEGDQASDTFFGSVTFRWNRLWSVFLELQDGEVDNVFLRVDPAEFQLARLRGTFRPTDRLSFSLSTLYRHGENPNPDVENTVDSRSYSISADYAGERLFFSTGYTAVNLDSTTDIVFCVGSPCTQTADLSAWHFADNHYFANVTYKFNDRFRGSLRGQMTDSRDTFPVDYYFAEPRLAVRLYSGFWANLGWYRYEFDRAQDDTQDYRAEGALFSISGEF